VSGRYPWKLSKNLSQRLLQESIDSGGNLVYQVRIGPSVTPQCHLGFLLKKPNQEPLFCVNQSKHEHQNNLSKKEYTKYMLKSVMIKTIESLKRIRMCNPN
jgi:hypothetical protein